MSENNFKPCSKVSTCALGTKCGPAYCRHGDPLEWVDWGLWKCTICGSLYYDYPGKWKLKCIIPEKYR